MLYVVRCQLSVAAFFWLLASGFPPPFVPTCLRALSVVSGQLSEMRVPRCSGSTGSSQAGSCLPKSATPDDDLPASRGRRVRPFRARLSRMRGVMRGFQVSGFKFPVACGPLTRNQKPETPNPSNGARPPSDGAGATRTCAWKKPPHRRPGGSPVTSRRRRCPSRNQWCSRRFPQKRLWFRARQWVRIARKIGEVSHNRTRCLCS
jgi:hypothetical protein